MKPQPATVKLINSDSVISSMAKKNIEIEEKTWKMLSKAKINRETFDQVINRIASDSRRYNAASNSAAKCGLKYASNNIVSHPKTDFSVERHNSQSFQPVHYRLSASKKARKQQFPSLCKYIDVK